MSYLPTVSVVVVGVVLFVLVLVRAAGHIRRFRRTVGVVGDRFRDETGTVRARVAGVRVAMRQTRARVKRAPADVPSIGRGRQEDDRG